MALIKCEDCGKEISDKAVACPNCGCPVDIRHEDNNIVSIKIDNVTQVQIILQKCYAYRKSDDKLLGTCKQGEILNIEISKKTDIYLKSKNWFGKLPLTVCPGEKYVLKQNGMMKPYITKVDVII